MGRRVSPPSKSRTGPASLRRSVCAPGWMSVHCNADHASEQTMNPLLYGLTRYFRCPQRARRNTRTGHGKLSRRTAKPRLEVLEDRTLPSAYVVTTTADFGPGSLRDAITQINADTSHTLYASAGNPSVDEIDFNITAASDTGGG